MEKDVSYLHVKNAMENSKVCFLCTLENEIEKRYIDTYLYELVMDASSRQKVIESRGFCNHHYYKMLLEASKPESSDGHGMALIMKSVVEQLIQDIRMQSARIKETTEIEKRLKQTLPNERKCPACVHLDEFILMYANKFLEIVSNGESSFLKSFESSGLCLAHYATVLDQALNLKKKNEETIKLIMNLEEASLRETDKQLAEYIRKQDYRFSEEKPDEEIIFRTVSRLAGRRGARPIFGKSSEVSVQK